MNSELAANLISGHLVPRDDGPDRHSIAVGGGQAEVYCDISPEKPADNQDCLMTLQLSPDRCLLAVADGAGGIYGGRRAARLALQTLRDQVRDANPGSDELRTAVLSAMEVANAAVISATRGAACTLTAATVDGREVRVFHVGDSVALMTGQRSALKLQTVAHSPVGFALAGGFLTEQDAMFHPERHVVSNFVGTQEMVIEVGPPITMAKHDSILLASDGLTDNLYTDEILSIMRRGPIAGSLDKLVEKTVNRMRHRDQMAPGKADDLAIILFRKPA